MGIFRKKKAKDDEQEFVGVREFNNTISVNALIIKLGGRGNITKSESDEEGLIIYLKIIDDINFKYFKSHKIIRNFFVDRNEQKISLVFDSTISAELAKKINRIIA